MSHLSRASTGFVSKRRKNPKKYPFGLSAEDVWEATRRLRQRYVLCCKAADVAPLRSLLEHIADCLEEEDLITKLVFSEEAISDAGTLALVQVLQNYAYLRQLAFWRTNSQDRGLSTLASFLSLNPAALTHLEFMDCRATAVSCGALGRALASNSHLKVLCLDHNKIGDQGVAHLAAGLVHNRTLAALRLKWTDCGDDGAVALADVLRQGALKELDLQGNLIGSKGIAAMAVALPLTQTLVRLVLADNQLFGGDDNAWMNLFAGLRANSTLKVLDASRVPLRTRPARALHELVDGKDKGLLVDVRIAGEHMDKAVCAEITAFLAKRRKPKKKKKPKKKPGGRLW